MKNLVSDWISIYFRMQNRNNQILQIHNYAEDCGKTRTHILEPSSKSAVQTPRKEYTPQRPQVPYESDKQGKLLIKGGENSHHSMSISIFTTYKDLSYIFDSQNHCGR